MGGRSAANGAWLDIGISTTLGNWKVSLLLWIPTVRVGEGAALDQSLKAKGVRGFRGLRSSTGEGCPLEDKEFFSSPITASPLIRGVGRVLRS